MIGRDSQGLSLIELLVVLALISVLTSGALSYILPNFEKTKTYLASEALLHQLHYARIEAIKKNQIVGLCGLGKPQGCTDNWQAGYCIFTHPPHSPKKVLLHIHEAMPGGPHLEAQFNSLDNTLSFSPDGRAQNNGHITLTHPHTELTHTVVVSLTGRARVLSP